jgi:uncharacterized protein YjbI with pentapeptide repeats
MQGDLATDAQVTDSMVRSTPPSDGAEGTPAAESVSQTVSLDRRALMWNRFRTFVEVATAISIAIGVWQFYLDRQDQRTARVGSAWELMIASKGTPGDFGRREALEVIRSSRHTLHGLQMDAAILPNLNLENEVLTSGSLNAAMLDTAHFNRVNLDSLDGRRLRANAIELSRVTLHGARLDSAVLRGFQITGTSGSAISAVGGSLDGGSIEDSRLYFSPADRIRIEETWISGSRIQLRAHDFTMRRVDAFDTEFTGAAGAVLAVDMINACFERVRIFDIEANRLNWSLVVVQNSELTDLTIHSGVWSGVGLWNSTVKRSTIAAEVLERIAGDSTQLRDVTILPRSSLPGRPEALVVDSGFVSAGGLTLFSAGRVQRIPIDERQQRQAASYRLECQKRASERPG